MIKKLKEFVINHQFAMAIATTFVCIIIILIVIQFLPPPPNN